MELPVQTTSKTRSIADVRAIAIAAQANLVQLKVADARRRGIAVSAHEIKSPSPSTVHRFRETLITHDQLHSYRPEHVQLRLHEVWGQFCLFRWVLQAESGDDGFSFASLAADAALRCDAHLAVKHDEIHAMLWRLRFEQRVRSDTTYADSASFKRDQLLASQIPTVVMGQSVLKSKDDELLAVSCEHAGMLAAIRWIVDRGRTWGEAGIMDVGERPF